ncbi:complement factor H-related protein 1-like [Cervus elaphus]|uniref:complement factor H-related protein 1-like n=1 Tax=Cervus elaphus TaxID=9860 RepID=UPI001CC27708|nr:complement factor H-related protein 1-like [Cervus elaphus]
MFLLINVALILWFSCVHGQVKSCDFPVIKHGKLYYAFKGYFPASVGQQFSYRCKRHFVTPSQSSWDYMTCTLKGWSPEVPCLRQCTFNYLENGYYTNSHEKYLQGKTVRVRCHDGYSLHNNQNTMTCTEKGWYPPPICVRVGLPCGLPPSVQNGVVRHKKDSYQYGEKVRYTCNKGFRIYGFASIRCLGGKWSRTPKCISTDCFNLPSFDDAVFIGQKKKSYRSGEQVAFKCRPYYQLNGSNTIQCVKSKWIGRPVCKDVSCVNPPRVENAVIQNDRPRYLNGERVRYECIGTYDILGDVDVTCLNGTWTKPPQCKEACEISEEMMKKYNIQLKWTTSKKLYSKTQDRIEFICKSGYHPVTPDHTFRTACQEGKVVYPHCGQNTG